MATLKLEIVTPETTAYSEDVEMVTLPGAEGELGIYPNHVPLLTTLNPGELRVLKGGKETFLAIGEGFVEITGNSVSVLTDMALDVAGIDENAAEAAVARAKAAMKEDLGSEDIAAVQASLQKALAQLHVKAVAAEAFQLWRLSVHPAQTGTLTCEDGNGIEVYRKALDFTDFPVAGVTLYFTDNTILLPSEY